MDLVDDMAEVQSVDRPVTIKKCLELGIHSERIIGTKYQAYNEIRLISDCLMLLGH